MSFRATYYVTMLVDAPVSAETFEQAVEAAKKKTWDKIVKLRPGVERCDQQVQLYNIIDADANGEM